MTSLAEQHRAEADRRIAEAEARAARQRVLLGELAVDGHATDEAEALLASLGTLRAHRAVLLDELAGALRVDKPILP